MTCMIYQYRSLTMTSPQILVSAYDRGRLRFIDFGAVPGFKCATPKWPAVGIDDFAYLIPLDCPTSTPTAARKRTLKVLPGSGGGGTDLSPINFSPPRISSPRRKRMPLETIDNSPQPWLKPSPHPQERKTPLKMKGKERMPVQVDVH